LPYKCFERDAANSAASLKQYVDMISFKRLCQEDLQARLWRKRGPNHQTF